MTLRTPDWQSDDGTIRLYCCDCLDLLPTIERGEVDAVVTDPPYGVQIADWDDSVPHHLCAEFRRLTAGPIVWFGAATQHRNDMLAFDPPPQRVCIWNPAFTLSKTMAHGMAYRWHPVYCWQLPNKHDGPTWDVWRHMCDGHNEWNHPATKPIDLILDCVNIAEPDATILDCFMGSGTTGVACIRTNRKFIGIEKEPKYFNIAVKRCKDAIDQYALFAPPPKETQGELIPA